MRVQALPSCSSEITETAIAALSESKGQPPIVEEVTSDQVSSLLELKKAHPQVHFALLRCGMETSIRQSRRDIERFKRAVRSGDHR